MRVQPCQERVKGGCKYFVGFLLVAAFLAATSPVFAAADYLWTFSNNGLVDYRLTSVSSTDLYAGSLPANDPTVRLIQGKRYGVTVVDFNMHPFQFIAKGATAAGDGVLLTMGGGAGSFAVNPAVNWVDNGMGYVEFTLTADLLAAARSATQSPGYRCALHPSDIGGNFEIFGDGVKIDDPIPGSIAKGTVRVALETLIDGLVAPHWASSRQMTVPAGCSSTTRLER